MSPRGAQADATVEVPREVLEGLLWLLPYRTTDLMGRRLPDERIPPAILAAEQILRGVQP